MNGGIKMTQIPPDDELYRNLQMLIGQALNKEHECREFLKYRPEILFKETVVQLENTDQEYRGNSGDSDYIISAKIRDESGIECVRVYIWELKAPQCYIFEKDNENRLKPTGELISAENQLLHYYHEQRGSDQFRQQFNVTHPDHVCFGGIIIGSSNRLVKGDYEEIKKAKLYERAISIRRQYFYNACGIRIITWDSILALFRPTIIPIPQTSETQQEIPTPLATDNFEIESSGENPDV
jgi:hypothetical protein